MRPGARTGPSIDIVIVNWNAGRHLGACLRSIVRADRSGLRVARVVVVDNASTDNSLTGLATPGIPLDVVRNDLNVGFASACNQGAALCGSGLLLFLNPDTELYPDALGVLGEFLRTPAAEEYGIFGVLMVDEDGRPRISCSRFPSLRIYFGKMTGLDRLVPAFFPPHHLRPRDMPSSGPVDQVIGACFLVRRALFDDLHGFDERYFLYLEEVDFALRARQAGRPSCHVHQARVYHAEEVSSSQLGAWRHYLMLCSRTRYAFLHWTKPEAWMLTALSLSLEPVARLVAAVVRGQRADIRANLAVHWRFLRWLGDRGRPGACEAAGIDGRRSAGRVGGAAPDRS
jgi:GT2 family glycosyltransferase